MKNKTHYFLFLLFLATIISACDKKIFTDFSYSPDNPVIGDSVLFINLSAGGEDFDWTFKNDKTGSIGRSTQKAPSRIFTSSGYYSVTLRVDSNDNNVRTKTIFVWDSIPSITRNKETVELYTGVTFSALAYNPFGRTKSFQWLFSNNVSGESLTDTVVDGINLKVSHEADPLVYFSQRNVDETVKLRMAIGDSIYTTTQIPHNTFTVNDLATRSLLMAKKGGNVLRQRIFDKGTDAVEETGIYAGVHPFNIVSSGAQLFIFDAGTHIGENAGWETDTRGDGSIRVIDLTNDSEAGTVISNVGTSSYFGFYNGFVDADNIYWTDRNNFAYQTPKTTRALTFEWKGSAQQDEVSYYLAADNAVITDNSQQGQFNGGIYVYDDLYYLAKGGAGKGLYRFEKNNGQINTFRVLLLEYSIRAFAYDRKYRQIYFSSTAPVGFYVSNMDGLEVRKIDDAPMDNALEYITGIVVDAAAGKVLWAYRAPDGSGHESGIKQIKTVLSGIEKPETPTYFNYEKDIYGITLDNNLKLAK